MRRLWIALAVPLLALPLGAEIALRAAAPGPAPASPSQSCVVLVLGSPATDDGQPTPTQRRRVEQAVSIYQAYGCTRMVLSGGAVANEHIEAEVMATLAGALGIPPEARIVEDHATNTWQNVGCSRARLAEHERILIVSNSLHAQRGKRYLCSQHPDACPRAEAVGYVPALLSWRKVPHAYAELAKWLRDVLRHGAGGARSGPVCPAPAPGPGR